MYINEFVSALVPHLYTTVKNNENAYESGKRLQFRPFDEFGDFYES